MRLHDLFESEPIRLKLSGSMMTIPMDGSHSEDDPEPRVIRLRGMGMREGTPVSRFISDWEQMTEPHPMNDRKRLHGGAQIEIAPSFGDNRVRLHDILSNERGQGSRAIKELCWLADKHDIELELTAMGYGKTPTERLVGWYEKFGFRPLRPDWQADIHPEPEDDRPYFTPTVDMIREPQE